MNDGLNQRGVLCRKSAATVKGFDTGLVGMFQNGNRMIDVCDQNILTSNSSLPKLILVFNIICHRVCCVDMVISINTPPHPPEQVVNLRVQNEPAKLQLQIGHKPFFRQHFLFSPSPIECGLRPLGAGPRYDHNLFPPSAHNHHSM